MAWIHNTRTVLFGMLDFNPKKITIVSWLSSVIPVRRCARAGSQFPMTSNRLEKTKRSLPAGWPVGFTVGYNDKPRFARSQRGILRKELLSMGEL